MSRRRPGAVPAVGTTANVPRPSYGITAALTKLAVSPVEEAFFRTGEQPGEIHDFSDLDDGHRPATLWRLVVGWLRGERTRHPD